MEDTQISVKDFLSQIAAPHGLQLENVERTFREEIAAGKDFGIFVGLGKHYTIPLEDLKKYFEEKGKPKAVIPEDKGAFEDFMKDGPVVPPAKAPTPAPAPVPAVKAKDVK